MSGKTPPWTDGILMIKVTDGCARTEVKGTNEGIVLNLAILVNSISDATGIPVPVLVSLIPTLSKVGAAVQKDSVTIDRAAIKRGMEK